MASSQEVAQRLRVAAEAAVEAIGSGYDLTEDLRLKDCKSRLIEIDDGQVEDIAIPGGIVVQDVPNSINCDKGELLRFSSDVLSFNQMSEQFNQELALSGKIPAGHFNAAFEFTGSWQKDAAYTKALAFDGVSLTLFSIALEKSQVTLCDHVKEAVPSSSWDPTALARFIEKFGTHVVVGVKMGGKDFVYVKQEYLSPLQSAEIQKKLKDVADKRFIDSSGPGNHKRDMFDSDERAHNFVATSKGGIYLQNEDIAFFVRRKGGSSTKNVSHGKWCQTVPLEPDVISMSLVPISSLLSGVRGSGWLSHAINLYLRYKPPIEELYQFLHFQVPRQWAPVYGELSLVPNRKRQSGASLQFSFMGPKLYVNTCLVDVENRPVTGLRLYLEGKKSNRLAIHLQHLSCLPKNFQLHNECNGHSGDSNDPRWYEKVQWSSFSHLCTAPVESDDDLAIVTGAQFETRVSGMKTVLFLRLLFSKVVGAVVVKQPEWDGSRLLTQKSGIISTLISSGFSSSQKPAPHPSDVNINSALYPGGPPLPSQPLKLLRFVDTNEITRGPEHSPGYWVVSGARLVVDKAKISFLVKYSLLTSVSSDE